MVPSKSKTHVLGDAPFIGGVFLCHLDKERPAVVVKIPVGASRAWVVPITTQDKDSYGRRLLLLQGEGGLVTKSWAKLDHVQAIDRGGIGHLIGTLGDKRIEQIRFEVDAFFL